MTLLVTIYCNKYRPQEMSEQALMQLKTHMKVRHLRKHIQKQPKKEKQSQLCKVEYSLNNKILIKHIIY